MECMIINCDVCMLKKPMQRVKWPCSRRGARAFRGGEGIRDGMKRDQRHQFRIAHDGRKRGRRRRQTCQSVCWLVGRPRVVSAKDPVEAFSESRSSRTSSLARPPKGSRLHHQSSTLIAMDCYRELKLTARHRLNPSKASLIFLIRN
jgi:hypothetical protein